MNHHAEQRKEAGIALLQHTRSSLLQLGIPHKRLLMQEGGMLPGMRPPILLNAAGLDILSLAECLTAFTTGRMMSRQTGQSSRMIPVLVGVHTMSRGQQLMLATCPAVQAVFSLPLNECNLLHFLSMAKMSVVAHSCIWFTAPSPVPIASKLPDVSRMLVAMSAASTYDEAATIYGVRRPAFRRALTSVIATLDLPTTNRHVRIQTTLERLLTALDSP